MRVGTCTAVLYICVCVCIAVGINRNASTGSILRESLSLDLDRYLSFDFSILCRLAFVSYFGKALHLIMDTNPLLPLFNLLQLL